MVAVCVIRGIESESPQLCLDFICRGFKEWSFHSAAILPDVYH